MTSSPAQDVPDGILSSGQQAMLCPLLRSEHPQSVSQDEMVSVEPLTMGSALISQAPGTIHLVTLFFHAFPFAPSQFQSCRTNAPPSHGAWRGKYLQSCCCTDCLPQGFFQFLFLLFQRAVLCWMLLSDSSLI